MSIVGNAVKIHARLLRLPRRAGLTQYQHQVRVIRYRIPDGQTEPVEEVREILPYPRVQPVPAKLVGTVFSNDVIVSEKDLQITSIVRSHAEQDLLGEWEISGHRGYRLISLVPRTTTWTAIVTGPYDRNFAGNYPETFIEGDL